MTGKKPLAWPWRAPFRPLGLRREVVILVPVALTLLVVVSIFTLTSYRSGIDLLVEERRLEALRLARAVAEQAAGQPPANASALRRLLPPGVDAALVDARGWPALRTGDLPPLELGALAAAGEPPRARAFGPDESLPGVVVAVAPLEVGGQLRLVRVDVPAAILDSHRRRLGTLTVLVVGVHAAVVLLMLFFVRHLLSPYESLLARARHLAPAPEPGGQAMPGDELDLLLQTFDRAVTALAERTSQPEDDIEALERTLTSSLESGVLLLDREGAVLALNALGASLLGVEAAAGRPPVAELLGGHAALARLLGEVVSSGEGIQRQEVRLETEGTVRTLGLTAHPLRRDDGSVRGFLVLFADLTEAQRLAEEARLEESLAQLGELAGGVAHELRNSLATLRGYLSLIEREPDESAVRDYLGEIRRETDHLKRVLEDFLTFARPGSVRAEEVPLEVVVRRSAADPALGDAAIRTRFEAAGPARVYGDPQLLERAVKNLLHNAVKSQAAGAQAVKVRATRVEDDAVEVRLEEVDEGLRLTVEDRGVGLPPEVEERLFQPFAAGFADGVGLGLALTHRIVALHRGRLRVENRTGGGVRAEILFPRDTLVTEGSNAAAHGEAESDRPLPPTGEEGPVKSTT